MKQTILVTTTAIITLVLFCMQLYVSNRLATMGADLSSMQRQTEELTLDNEMLEHEIASHSSRLVVQKRAHDLGFTPATVRYLERPPVALMNP